MKNILSFLKKYWFPISAFIISLFMFIPSINGFFTHDDFYFLKISKIDSVGDFIGFFDPAKDVSGIGVYRPLPLRVYYFLGSTLFKLNPVGLRVISFATFFLDIFLVEYLAKLLSKNDKIAALSVFLYAISVTHFGQLYYVGAYQELLVTFFVLSSVILFAKSKTFISFIFYVLALMSKETAVVLPALYLLVYFYQNKSKINKTYLKQLIKSLVPFVLLLVIYLYLKFFHFGTIEGNSYIWNFSLKRALNTVVWYFLWCLNLPETLVDFVGPGFHLNPNLMKYWSAQMIPIFILFTIQAVLILFALIKSLKSKILNFRSVVFFSIFWFLITILPIVFLPLHKFTYYLTLPLFGVVFLLSYLFVNLKSKIYILFCVIWVAISLFSLRLTRQTNWITKGSETAKKVYVYMEENMNDLKGENIVFVDTPNDKNLPWSPTATLKTVLSDQNFFEVFYPGEFSGISYGGDGDVKINSRQFLGY